jgi:putative transposase
MPEDAFGVGPDSQIPDALWVQMLRVFPPPKARQKDGRPRMDDRQAMTAMLSVWRPGCQWQALPRRLGAASTVHDRFQAWRGAQVFERLWQAGLLTYETLKGLEWEWQAMDGAMTKAPLGGKQVGKNPTDRGTLGTKRSVLTDGQGLPLGVAVDGANRHEMKVVDATLEAIMIKRPAPSATQPQHPCLAKGYDYEAVRETLAAWNSTAHLRRRGDEAQAKRAIPGYRARRWVVGRTHSWMNRFRRVLIRWEKKVDNYLAWLHFACAWITFRAAELFG